MLYILLDKNLLNINHVMENYIRVKEASVSKQDHPCFHTQEESLPRHQSPTWVSKKSLKRNIYDRLTFSELVTILLTMTSVEALANIKGKDSLQHSCPMKNGSNTKNPNKFRLFHYDYDITEKKKKKSVTHS